MKEYERHGILKFVSPSVANLAVLLIESEELLPELRKLLPESQIALMIRSKSEDTDFLCKKNSADLIIGDYTRNALPIDAKIFDIILAKDCLTFAPDFYVTLLEMNHLLKDSGYLVTQFFNARFIQILEGLRRGKFPTNGKRFWAKADIVKLLDDAIYKEIRFLPEEQFKENYAENLSDWEDFGFENFNGDLLTKIWLVKAQKCESEVAALKSLYSEEVRAEISRLLHRVEYDIDAEENFSRLIELCRREQIFEDYLADFVRQVVLHSDAIEFIKKSAKKFNVELDL